MNKGKLEQILKEPINRRDFLKSAGVLFVLKNAGKLVLLEEALRKLSGCATMQRPEIVYPAGLSCPRIGSDYGVMTNPDGSIRKIGGPHNGIDIVETIGYPVIAAADGEVRYADYDSDGGNQVRLYHGKDTDGTHILTGYSHIFTTYAHMDQLFVTTGQRVKRGERIGTIGDTGSNLIKRSSRLPPNLHFMVEIATSGSSYVKDNIHHIRGNVRIVNPNDFWIGSDKTRNPDDKIIIPPFIEGRKYPTKPIRFTYAVPCE